ncbi:PAS domain-containing protein [uncultured Methanospirillum sp.]|uniref:response regulator n=1 Tax=uncultured Methanospirillum sp. TaxID=262503 RepID=UPI0029C6CF27|nr:PAS domain-containing protein [uncultured Methanospirillum sp.]
MLSLLYIDDEKDLLEIGKLFLERSGDFIVDTLSSPDRVLDIIRSNQYDAIISDYEMPGLNGIELLKKIRSEFGDIPFILFTGRGREDVVIEAINNGADFYIQKGGEPQSQFAELGHQIKQAVAKRQAECSLVESVEKLRASSSRFEALILASNTGAWEYDSSGNFWCSPEYFSMLGRNIRDYGSSESQDFKKVWIDLIHPDDREQAVKAWNSYLVNPEGMYEQYFRMLHQDGHWVWILSRGKTLQDSSGYFTPVTIGTHIDVTGQKLIEEQLLKKNEELQATYEEIIATEEELRTNYNELVKSKQALEISENRYSLTLESINDGLWDLNIATGVLFLSPQFYRMCGYQPDAFPPDIAHWASLIHPDDQERVQILFNKTLMNGDNLFVEYRVLRSDDTYQWILERGKVIEWSPEGKPRRVLGTHTDITARKEIEEKLDEKSRVLQTLTDNLPGMVYRCRNDQNWTMEVISDGVLPLTGYQKEEMLYNRDVSYGSIIHPDDQKIVWDFVEEGVINSKPFELRYRIICKDSSVKWVWEQGRGVFQGEILQALEGYITDITPEIAAQKALQKLAHSIEHLKEGVFWFNSEGIIYDTNIAFSEFSSQSKGTIIRSHVSVLPFILQSKTWSELMDLAKSTGSISEGALLNISPDTQKNLHMSISYGQFGEESVFCGIINDRTKEEEYLSEVVRSREELASAYEELLSSEESLKDQYLQLTNTKEALQESEYKFRSIFEDAILGIFKVTKEGSIINVNPAFARIHGFDTPDEMKAAITDIRSQMYVHPEDRDLLLRLLEENGEVRGFEVEKYRKDGSTVWISVNEKVIRYQDGESYSLEGTIEDITRRKTVEYENGISLNQLRKNFAEFSILNDGIRNPLTVLAILAESCDPIISDKISNYIQQIDDLINQVDNRWVESEKVISYLQKHHNY